MNRKIVYIAGGGPGNRYDVTLRVINALKIADVVLYDDLIDDSLLDYCKINCEKIYVGKRSGKHSLKQSEIDSLLIQKALSNDIVLRLKGGDPFIFGRAPEECEALNQYSIYYEFLPGVSSVSSVPMSAGIPVTYRKEARSFTVLTGHTANGRITDEIDLSPYAKIDGTLIILMGLGSIREITDTLIKHGKDENTPVAIISNGTRNDQYVLRGKLNNIADKKDNDPNIVTPAIIVIGKCAGLDLRSQADLPLKNTNSLILGSKEFCSKLSQCIHLLGGRCDEKEIIRIDPYFNEDIKNALNNLSSYTHLVFTGGNSIRIFFSYLSMLNIDYRVLYNLKIAVIGKGTMLELKKFGINADIMPEYYNSDSLSKCLISSCKDQLNANVLIPRAKKGNNVLSDELKKSAVNYTELPLYNTVHTSSSIHNLEYFDNIIFASSEGVRSFYETNDSNVLDKIKNIICIGEYTANTLKSFGINNYLIPDESSVQGICNLMVNLKGDSNE